MLGRIVYVSRAAPGLGMTQVCAIVREADARNGAEALSGALLFLDGWFVQLIEGPRERLEARFARIRGDARHAAVAVRQRGAALCPLFPEQRIALRLRADLDPALLEAFHYRPGLPVESFPADVLVEFVVRACTRHRDRQRRFG
jgi:hypothetical protein